MYLQPSSPHLNKIDRYSKTVKGEKEANIFSSNKNTKKQQQKKTKLYGPLLWMGFNCLKATATSRRQFTFYH